MFCDPQKISQIISVYRFSEALRYIEKTGIRSFLPEYYFSLRAEIFLREANFFKALEEIDRALSFAPRTAAFYNIRGNILTELGRFDSAMTDFDRAVDIEPEISEFRFNRGQLRLLLGDWLEAREDYEFRLKSALFQPPPTIAAYPLWSGTFESGRRILLYWEQGQGDTIQFIRYVRVFLERGYEVYLEVQESLFRLIAASYPQARFLRNGDRAPQLDARAPLPSLPWLLAQTPERIFAPRHYLTFPAAPNLPRNHDGPAVGLVWAGNPDHVNDRQRSIPCRQLLSLTNLPGINFFALQKEVTEKSIQELARLPVQNLSKRMTDFADTAALIQGLDLVITVDTSVAHLAGALGKPVWILLPLVPDWRWLLGRKDSPWYPSARLFRQSQRGNWSGVLGEVREALAALGASS